ncbi:altronate dehydratase family protein [Persicobacter diffluens]|uniref:Altronate hydrolase n=1 Tax=Persicobacter diffluens TaxID=981 RepID=A0AAN4W403_9BACT|nr:altronate hydrolase [Persicobacter diffluens]
MHVNTLKVHASDNIIVALRDLNKGETVATAGASYLIKEVIPAKHKFAAKDFEVGDLIIMYGLVIGQAFQSIKAGELISVDNVKHATKPAVIADSFNYQWQPPQVEEGRTFMGYHRSDGQVGTRNVWLVVPLVFCENRNILEIKRQLEPYLGYNSPDFDQLGELVHLGSQGASVNDIQNYGLNLSDAPLALDRPFKNVDGVKFITHHAGCGGTRADAERFCRMLAGYLLNPNVGGATILSLGCQNAQISLFEEILAQMAPAFDKPVYIHEQQQSASEKAFIADAVKSTVAGLSQINQIKRAPASIKHLVVGLECGGSDGFSGISANPLLGKISDRVVAAGGTAILAEFPELNGVEQNILDRCVNKSDALNFKRLMEEYGLKAKAAGSGFEFNPSPGNIKDGLITDAMKSAGAAKKGGEAPIQQVLDFTEQLNFRGLNLLCTPGNDVESTTALAASGTNLILFSTGLGTPTGNPAAPVIKVSSNSVLAKRMSDIIDFDAGTIIDGQQTMEQAADDLLELMIRIASGQEYSCSEVLGQEDFIPWRQDLSL